MKRTILSTVILLLLVSINLYSEEIVEQGFKFGLNTSNFVGDNTSMFKARKAFIVGGYATYKSSEFVDIQGELNLTMKGAYVEEDGEKFEMNLNYLEVPIMGKYQFQNKQSKVRPYFMMGPSIAIKLSAKGKLMEDGQSNEGDIENVRPLDIGIVFCGGVLIEKILIEGRYTRSISKVLDDTGVIHNSVFSILVGFKVN